MEEGLIWDIKWGLSYRQQAYLEKYMKLYTSADKVVLMRDGAEFQKKKKVELYSLLSVISTVVIQRESLFFPQVRKIPVSFIIYATRFHRRAHQLKHNHILIEN